MTSPAPDSGATPGGRARTRPMAPVTSALRRFGAGLPAAARRALRSRVTAVAWLVVLALIGAVVGLLVAGTVKQQVGPVQTTMALRPALGGESVVHIAPLGELGLDTHDGPARLDVSVDQVLLDEAETLVTNPIAFQSLGDEIGNDVTDGLRKLAIRSALVALAGSMLLTLVVYRRWRPVVAAAAVTTVALAGTAGAMVVTWREDALASPRYTGALALAPRVIGDVENLQSNFARYSDELTKIVTNVSELYGAGLTLPGGVGDGTIRALHVSDIHLNTTAFRLIRTIVTQFDIDLVLDSGDIADHGSALENELLRPIATIPVPYVYVRGNHDSMLTQNFVRSLPNAVVLDGDVREVAGLRLAGIGDPRFTPDRDKRLPTDEAEAALVAAGERLANVIGEPAGEARGADVALAHDPTMAPPLFGRVPLVLSGHTHDRRSEVTDGTRLLVQGSTGGAGLRALETDIPTPVMLSVLYFDGESKELVAYDDLTIGGLGLQSVQIERHATVDDPLSGLPELDELTPTPTPTPTDVAPADAPTTDESPTSPAAPAGAPTDESPLPPEDPPTDDGPPAGTDLPDGTTAAARGAGVAGRRRRGRRDREQRQRQRARR